VNTKDTNPKDAIGVKKLAYSMLPWRALTGVALAMQEGALKYRRHNYRVAGVRASVYFDACLRHVGSWWEGEENAPDGAQLHHLDYAIASLLILRDGMYHGNLNDDRPPKGIPTVAIANKLAEKMINEAKDPQPPYTQKGLLDAMMRAESEWALSDAVAVAEPIYEDEDEGVIAAEEDTFVSLHAKRQAQEPDVEKHGEDLKKAMAFLARVYPDVR